MGKTRPEHSPQLLTVVEQGMHSMSRGTDLTAASQREANKRNREGLRPGRAPLTPTHPSMRHTPPQNSDPTQPALKQELESGRVGYRFTQPPAAALPPRRTASLAQPHARGGGPHATNLAGTTVNNPSANIHRDCSSSSLTDLAPKLMRVWSRMLGARISPRQRLPDGSGSNSPSPLQGATTRWNMTTRNLGHGCRGVPSTTSGTRVTSYHRQPPSRIRNQFARPSLEEEPAITPRHSSGKHSSRARVTLDTHQAVHGPDAQRELPAVPQPPRVLHTVLLRPQRKRGRSFGGSCPTEAAFRSLNALAGALGTGGLDADQSSHLSTNVSRDQIIPSTITERCPRAQGTRSWDDSLGRVYPIGELHHMLQRGDPAATLYISSAADTMMGHSI